MGQKVRITDTQHLKFAFGGLFTSEGVWRHPERTIDTHELILVIHGTVYIREGEQSYALQPGDYLLLHAGIPHGSERSTEEKVSFYWLHFHGHPVPAGSFCGSLSNPGILVQCARQLLQIHQTPGYPEGTADAMLQVLLAELGVQREAEKAPSALAAQTHEYIRSHSSQPLLPSAVADAMGYSQDHLSRVLKRAYGRTLRQEIVSERMNRARLLLQTTSMSISQLAFALGWKDPNLFEKFFRYHQNCTPTAYRQSFPRSHTNHK